MNRETERLVKEVKKELHALKIKVEKERNPKLSKACRKLLSTLK